MGDQLSADVRRFHGAHVNRQRLLALRQQRPIKRRAVRFIVTGDKNCALRIIAMGQRNAGIGRRARRGGNAWHHLERDPGGGGRLQFFPAAPENKRIAALQAHYRFPRFGSLHQHLIRFVLRYGVLARALANADHFGIAAHQFPYALGHQVVIKHHVRLLNRLQAA